MSDRFISEQQLKQAVREVLAEMLGIGSEHPASVQRQWYDTNSAYTLLGLDNAEQLRDAVRSGLLRVGQEVRDRRKPQAKLPRYQFHIEKCQKGVGKLQDESSRNRDISELEVMDQQSQGMLEHLNRFGIAQCFTMETS